ncbi:DMT family transporter [Roseibium sp. HPY-6]|uniref:DMT family transporter n=1 Tax=Roseibium sp. HPY-6 TaxID=3229852 RepID=UPI0033902281
MKENASPSDIALWLVLAALWSSSYTAIKIGVQSLDPVLLVAGRLLIGAFFLYAVLKMSRMRLSGRLEDWMHYGVSGLLGSAIPFLLISYGEQTVDSALASILMGIAPVTTVFMASFVFADEQLTRRIVLGLVCGIAGIVLLVGPGALAQLGGDLPAQLSILAAALCYGVTTIYVRRFVKRAPLEMAAGSTIVAAGAITAMAVFSGIDPAAVELNATSVGTVVYLGLFSTALATLIYFQLVPRLGATRMSQVNFAVPVGGALIGVTVLSETIMTHQLAALAVILVAIFLVTGKPRREG